MPYRDPIKRNEYGRHWRSKHPEISKRSIRVRSKHIYCEVQNASREQ